MPKMACAFEIIAVRIWPSKEYTRLAIEHLDKNIKIKYSNEKNPDKIIVDIFHVKVNRKNLSKLIKVNLKNTPVEKISVVSSKADHSKIIFYTSPLTRARISSIPSPVFPEQGTAFSVSIPITSSICFFVLSRSEAGKSTLFNTGTIS